MNHKTDDGYSQFMLNCIDLDMMHLIRVSKWDGDSEIYLEFVHRGLHGRDKFWSRVKQAFSFVFMRGSYVEADYVLRKKDVHELVSFLQQTLKDVN